MTIDSVNDHLSNRHPASVVEGGDCLLVLDQYGDVYWRLTGETEEAHRACAAEYSVSLFDAMTIITEIGLREVMKQPPEEARRQFHEWRVADRASQAADEIQQKRNSLERLLD